MLYHDQEPVHDTLILAMGNDILSDDAVAFLAGREVMQRSPAVDYVETGEAGLALLEFMEGYDRVLLLDSLMSEHYLPGSIVEFTPDAFSKVVAPSPHYAGLPEVFELAKRLGIEFPQQVVVLAMEVVDPYTVGGDLTPEVRDALPNYVKRAREVLQHWGVERSLAHA